MVGLDQEAYQGELKKLREHYESCPHVDPRSPIIRPMPRFENLTGSKFVEECIVEAEKILSSTSILISALKEKNDFKFNSGTGQQVVAQLLRVHPMVKVYYYRPWNPWSGAIGYYDGTGIYINSRIVLTREGQIANLLHEYAHHAGFEHGNNYWSQEKSEFSVPYYISDNIERWIK